MELLSTNQPKKQPKTLIFATQNSLKSKTLRFNS
ncbi:MAG: hypothetical protein ACI9AH_000535, partial [Oceanospirillaceae bacterium]